MSEHFNVEKDIMEKSGWTPEKKYRKRQDFLAALLRAACSMTNTAYQGLGEPSQDWAEEAAAVTKHNKENPDDHKPLPDFGGNGHDTETDDHPVQEFDDHGESSVDDSGTSLEGQEAGANDAGGVGQVEHTQTHTSKKRTIKAKATKAVKPKKEKATSRTLNEWGVVKGTKSDHVCQMMARPEGITQKEISDAVGQTHYNLVARLRRRCGEGIVKYDGSKIWLLRKEPTV